eukprot:Blabericola_migrator_1__12919@NODE_84_length_14850_cov_98_458703_g75_i0_p4_GENE_NODE_84_length_14850_cov_98_458703_g75_i0NODE_84_length_14850_cov_98_458703_g75_i0_p4_ORF_typecomplete_len475_score68_37GST_N/PF02798_20/1_5e08GST_N/PF02798_20/6_7e03GST_C_3/PF14497_6/2_4e07GST_C_3/PF14497_6/4_2e03GST_N_3/PF13417_6/0_01Cob_adeno_trans/PF01923_18/0_33Cob_adeno_trans/PF01923_18/3_1e02GST_N_4/PF17172_4/0_42GST_N_4/PF17172_4/1e03GST_C/PF00043_25/0_32_NODE_84_length_14850_cov_98_458703_g75_i0912210546
MSVVSVLDALLVVQVGVDVSEPDRVITDHTLSTEKCHTQILSMSSQLPKLHYFDLPGKAEPIRLALHIAKIPFEDVRFTFEEWPTYKVQSPSGKCPYLIMNGSTYVETYPLALWACALGGLLPQSHAHMAMAKTLIDMMEPLFRPIALTYGGVSEDATCYDGIIAPVLRAMERRLTLTQNRDGYALPDGLSIADLYIAGIMYGIINNRLIGRLFVSRAFPRLSQVYSLVVAEPSVREYYNSTRHRVPEPLHPVTIPRRSPPPSSALSSGPIPPVAVATPHPVLHSAMGSGMGSGPSPLPTVKDPEAADVVLNRRGPEGRRDGTYTVDLLCQEGGVTYVYTSEPSNWLLKTANVTCDTLLSAIQYAVDKGRLNENLSPENQLLANIVATICCDIFKLQEQGSYLQPSPALEGYLSTLNTVLKQSPMASNWSDLCIFVVTSLIKDQEELQLEYPFIYLKKIQTPSLHPKVLGLKSF